MANILIVFTGGTIGSKRSGGGVVDVDERAGCELLHRYARSDRQPVHFDTVQPYQTLSENMNPGHWLSLAACLRERLAGPARHDGVIVTHGSDTLPYTAAMLSYAFADAPVPIVLVAANYPLDDPRSNGLVN